MSRAVRRQARTRRRAGEYVPYMCLNEPYEMYACVSCVSVACLRTRSRSASRSRARE